MNLRKLKFKEKIIPSKAYNFMFFGFIIIILGIACNFFIIKENNGLMPVVSDFNFKSTQHFKVSDVNEVNHLQFADIYHLFGNVYSIGDFLIWLGVIMVFLSCYIQIHNSILNHFIVRK